MKTITLIISILFIILSSVNSKSFSQTKIDFCEFEKKKVEYITEKAYITKEEGEKFFPIYTELSKKKMELYLNYKSKLKEKSSSTSGEYNKLIEFNPDYKLEEAELEKKYYEQLKDVISDEKLFKVQKAEREFIQKELQEIKSK